MKSVIVLAGATAFSFLLISCGAQPGSTTIQREQTNVTVSQSNVSSPGGNQKITVQQSGNSANVSINKDDEKNLTVTTGNSSVEISKSGISVKNSGETQTGKQNGSGNGKTITIDSNRETRTINCDGDELNISGNRNNLTVKGKCTINVSGNDNVIFAEGVREINVPGNNNKVTWTKAADGSKPEISNPGDGNTISSAN